MFTRKNSLPLLVLALMALLNITAAAQIRIEAAGLPTTKLVSCPQQTPLKCGKFYQYKVVGYYSQLSLGAARPQPSATGMPLKSWSRLSLRSTTDQFPIDIFKSSTAAHSSTGHQATACVAWNAGKQNNAPVIAVEGNTTQAQGYVVLCVDFIPAPPRPRGQLRLTRSSVRDGEKAPLAWKTQR